MQFGSKPSAYVHEVAHNIEMTSFRIRGRVKTFYDRRTAGEKAVKLQDLFPEHDYGPRELTKIDKWEKPYMGKPIDANGNSELISMGVEWLHKDAIGFARKDPDYFSWLIDTLRGNFKQ
ncbi:MAG: hypothetical protein IIC64_11195 [SAR324 cluster bacterium]|nr:hypothetical protein [SAR324 cluster bacterium]